MKLTALLLTLGCLQVNATAFSQRVTLSGRNVPMEKVFREIRKQTGYLFLYNNELLQQAGKISIHVTDAPLEQVLQECFNGQPLTYALVEKTIIVKPLEKTERKVPAAADGSIKGKVRDSNGSTLPAVTVRLEGASTQTTSTDANGNYSFTNLPAGNYTVSFTYLGFARAVKEVTLRDAQESLIDVTLTEEASSLSEVVVVGYGTQKKVSMTSAVSEVKGEDLVRRPVSNIAQAMQGKAPGLTILDNGGGPGKSKTTIRVRGVTTLSDNNPLIIVDGIEQRLGDINPNDIESISILKDASSTAIYGSRAANGVVLITTKRAKTGKVSVSYDGFYAVQKSTNNPPHMGLEDYMRMQNIAYQNVGSPPKYTEQYIQEYVNATDRYKYPLPYTMAEAVLRPAPQVNHSLSVSGGNENFRVRLSLRNQDQKGIIQNSNSRLNEVRLNTDFKASPKINIATDVNYRYVNSLAPVNEAIVFERLKHGSLWTVPKYPDGTYGISAQGQNALMYVEMGGTSKTANDYMIANVKGDWEILKGLIFTTQFAAEMAMTTQKSFDNSWQVRNYYKPEIIAFSRPINRLTEIRNNSREYTLNNLLNYSTTLGNHGVKILAGYSQIQNNSDTLNAYRQGFYNNDIQSIGQGTNDNTKNNGGGQSQWGLRSYFSRFNYSYHDRYLFEANARYDGSSRFTEANRYSFFPSFSAGWRVSQEKFWGNLSNTINEFKLRGSWGKTGNQAVALYSYFPTLDLNSYSFNNVPVQGYRQQQMTSENLTWETTTQSDVGFDAELFNSKLNITVDYYNKSTDGILLNLPVPGTLGLEPTPQNAGVVGNKGWEFSAGSRNNFGQFGFDANLNLSINNNNVISLAGTGPYITRSETPFITGEGYPIRSFWGYKTGGLFQTAEEVRNYPTVGAGIKPGDVKYLDLNKDGKINAADMTYLGPTFPKYIFGSSFNLTYKGFALNLLFQGAAGVKTSFSGSLGDYGNLEGFAHKILTNNYWTPERPNARFPRPTKFNVRNSFQSDRKILDASYLRMKNIQLVYRIPSSITKKAWIERMNVYVSGTNLLTFSKLNEWNLDPESLPGRVQDYPQTSLYTMGVNLQF